MSDNDKNPTDNNSSQENQGSPTPDNKPADTAPPVPENKPDSKTDDKSAEDNKSSSAEQTSASAAPTDPGVDKSDNVVKLSVDGVVKGSKTFPKGTNVRTAMKEFTNTPEDFSYRDNKNSAVSLDRVLNDNIEITATKKAAGG